MDDLSQLQATVTNLVEVIRRSPLNAQGVCGKCDKDAEGDSLRCFGCDELYHVIGCTGEKQVTRTFLDATWPSLSKLYTNIQYVCDACKQDRQAKKDIVISNRMCVMEEQMRDMANMMTEMKNSKDEQQAPLNNDALTHEVTELKLLVQNLVQKSVAAPETPTEPPKISYASKVEKSVIVAKKRATGQEANIEDIQNIAVRTGSAVSKAYRNETGDAVVVCENKDAQEKMRPALQNTMSDFKVVSPPARKPTINIAEISKKYSKEELFDVIKAQNASRGIDITAENFQILFVKPHQKDESLFMAAVRVADNLRDAIKSADNRIIVNSVSCPVFDRFFVRRCNYCQGLNHWKDDCNAENPICGTCAGEHETKNCDSETIKCVNCSVAGISNNRHKTSWYKCTAYENAQEKFKSTINYYNKLN